MIFHYSHAIIIRSATYWLWNMVEIATASFYMRNASTLKHVTSEIMLYVEKNRVRFGLIMGFWVNLGSRKHAGSSTAPQPLVNYLRVAFSESPRLCVKLNYLAWAMFPLTMIV